MCTFSIFKVDFRKENCWNQKICQDRLGRPYVNNIFWNYQGPPLRNKKVIRVPTTGSMTPKNWKFRTKISNFRWTQNIEIFGQTCRFRALGRLKNTGPPRPQAYKWFVEWLHRKVISSAGAIARRIGLVQCVRFRSSRSIFERTIVEIRKSVRIV